MESAPIADSLFVHGDSANFHKVTKAVIKWSDCVLSESKSEAEKLDAKVAKEINKERMSGWACHAHVLRMKKFHASIQANADKMSDTQWEEAFTTWETMTVALENDHRAAYCVETDAEAKAAMQLDFLEWTVSETREDAIEETGKVIEEIIDEGIRLIEDLFDE